MLYKAFPHPRVGRVYLRFFPCFTQENLDVTSLRPVNLFVLNLSIPLWVGLDENCIEM